MIDYEDPAWLASRAVIDAERAEHAHRLITRLYAERGGADYESLRLAFPYASTVLRSTLDRLERAGRIIREERDETLWYRPL